MAGPSGILLVDKPVGISSHGAVAAVRRGLGTRKVGHAGTLDPAASGLLVMGIGAGTRLLTYLVGLDKSYRATIRLGVATDTEDAAGVVIARPGCEADIDVAGLLPEFTGAQRQRPSSVSAIKVAGRRAYQRVRAGEDVELAEREVTIHDLSLADARPGSQEGVPVVDVDVVTTVSSGTYIRALARDLGLRLGTVAHLTSLRRTAVGPFGLDRAVAIADLTPGTPLLPLGGVARQVLPVVTIAPEEVAAVRFGQRIPAVSVEAAAARSTALLDPAGELLAVAQVLDGRWRYLMVAPWDESTGD